MRRFSLLLLLAVAPALCQTERGNITGQIRDSSGSVIPGAAVVATHISTNVETKSLSTFAGEYNLPCRTFIGLPLVAGGALRRTFDLATISRESHGSGTAFAPGSGARCRVR
jgi:hypothetical protein